MARLAKYSLEKTIGSYDSYRPTNVTLDKYYVNDENAIVDYGMIYDIEWGTSIFLTNSYTKCHAKESAFVAHDKFESEGKGLSDTSTEMTTRLSYCSNYGNAKNLICLSSFSYSYYFNYYYVEVELNDIANYGTLYDALFASHPYVCCQTTTSASSHPFFTSSSYYYYYYYNYYYYYYAKRYRWKEHEQQPLSCTRIVNFEKINKLTSLVGSGNYAGRISSISNSSKYVKFSYLFNAG